MAKLDEFEPIDFAGVNRIDAAVAMVIDSTSVDPDIIAIGTVNPTPAETALNQRVRKYGSTTGLTSGEVVDIAADIVVRYGSRTAVFEDQIGVEGVDGAFALEGDSGSLIVDAATPKALALLFAGGDRVSFANPIGTVLARFSAEFV